MSIKLSSNRHEPDAILRSSNACFIFLLPVPAAFFCLKFCLQTLLRRTLEKTVRMYQVLNRNPRWIGLPAAQWASG